MDILSHAWIAGCIAQTAWLVRLVRTGQSGRYRVLFFYLLATTLYTPLAMLVQAGQSREFYGWFWLLSRPLLWAGGLAVVLESSVRLFQAADESRTRGRVVFAVLGTVVALAVLPVVFSERGSSSAAAYWFEQEANLYMGLVVVSVGVIVAACMRGCGLDRTARNVLVVFGVIFAGVWLSSAAHHFGRQFHFMMSAALCVLSIAGYAAGALSCSAANEIAALKLGRRAADSISVRELSP